MLKGTNKVQTTLTVPKTMFRMRLVAALSNIPDNMGVGWVGVGDVGKVEYFDMWCTFDSCLYISGKDNRKWTSFRKL